MIVATQFYTSDIIIILGISHYKLGPGVPPKLPIKINSIVVTQPSYDGDHVHLPFGI